MLAPRGYMFCSEIPVPIYERQVSFAVLGERGGCEKRVDGDAAGARAANV